MDHLQLLHSQDYAILQVATTARGCRYQRSSVGPKNADRMNLLAAHTLGLLQYLSQCSLLLQAELDHTATEKEESEGIINLVRRDLEFLVSLREQLQSREEMGFLGRRSFVANPNTVSAHFRRQFKNMYII